APEACLRDRAVERRVAASSQGADGCDGASRAGQVCRAADRGADCFAGSSAARALPQHLGATDWELRSTREEIKDEQNEISPPVVGNRVWRSAGAASDAEFCWRDRRTSHLRCEGSREGE